MKGHISSFLPSNQRHFYKPTTFLCILLQAIVIKTTLSIHSLNKQLIFHTVHHHFIQHFHQCKMPLLCFKSQCTNGMVKYYYLKLSEFAPFLLCTSKRPMILLRSSFKKYITWLIVQSLLVLNMTAKMSIRCIAYEELYVVYAQIQ